MHHPKDRTAHITAFVTPVVEHWLEREYLVKSESCLILNLHHILPLYEQHLPVLVKSLQPSGPLLLTNLLFHQVDMGRLTRGVGYHNGSICHWTKLESKKMH